LALQRAPRLTSNTSFPSCARVARRSSTTTVGTAPVHSRRGCNSCSPSRFSRHSLHASTHCHRKARLASDAPTRVRASVIRRALNPRCIPFGRGPLRRHKRFVRRADAERFIEEVVGDEAEIVAMPPIEEKRRQAVGRNSPPGVTAPVIFSFRCLAPRRRRLAKPNPRSKESDARRSLEGHRRRCGDR